MSFKFESLERLRDTNRKRARTVTNFISLEERDPRKRMTECLSNPTWSEVMEEKKKKGEKEEGEEEEKKNK